MKRVRQIVGCDTPTDVDLPVAAFNVIGMIPRVPRSFRDGRRLRADQVAKVALAGQLRSGAHRGRDLPCRSRAAAANCMSSNVRDELMTKVLQSRFFKIGGQFEF